MDILMARKEMEGVQAAWKTAGLNSVPERLRLPLVWALMTLERLERESVNTDYVTDPANLTQTLETLRQLSEHAPVLRESVAKVLERLDVS